MSFDILENISPGIMLALTASQASSKAFSSSWIDKFHLIHYYSSNLTAPSLNVTEMKNDSVSLNVTEQNFNKGSSVKDNISVRDLFENEPIIKKLDKYLAFVDSVQRQLECCGVEGSHEWLSLYSGTFTHHKKTKQDLWWSDSWFPRRFTPSCCLETNFLCALYLEKNETKQPFYEKQIIGCRKKVVHDITKSIEIICSFLIGAIFIQLILSPFIYFFTERRRRTERVLHINKWRRQLEILLEQERKNNRNGHLPQIKGTMRGK
uniref:Uncharacterized protein n=1 Tax=Setaria digitata TaxID=48799 RepID=A0A915PPQ2_9BILA